MKITAKRTIEPPEAVKAAIDRALAVPVEATGRTLKEFVWTFDKGDVHHWITLLDRIDEYLECVLAYRSDVTLEYSGSVEDVAGCPPAASNQAAPLPLVESQKLNPPFPEEEVTAALRVTADILGNCSNKHLYASADRLSALLAAPSTGVVKCALRVLCFFLRRSHLTAYKWTKPPELAPRVVALAKATEQAPKLSALAHGNVSTAGGSAIKFLVPSPPSNAPGTSADAASPPATSTTAAPGSFIEIADVNVLPIEEEAAMASLVSQYAVPKEHRFSLLVHLRTARAVAEGSVEALQDAARVRLLAMLAALQLVPPLSDLNEQVRDATSDLIPQLVEILRGNDATSDDNTATGSHVEGAPDDIKALALRVWTTILLGRLSRHSLYTSAIDTMFAGGPTSLLALLLHRTSAGLVAAGSAAAAGGHPSPQFGEALMSLLGALAAHSAGVSMVTEAGLIPAIVPLLGDREPTHSTVVAGALRILESFLDYSPQLITQFRELGGPGVLLQRVREEIDAALQKTGKHAVQPLESSLHSPLPYAQRLLLKSILRTMVAASFNPSTPGVRPTAAELGGLFAAFVTIFKHPSLFGAGLFAMGANLVTNVIHTDPLQYRALDDAGVPEAFIQAVLAGVPPSQDAINAIPPTLSAFCLNIQGLQRVQQSRALHALVPIFTTRAYMRSLHGPDGAPQIGATLEELVRHSSALRPDVVTVTLEMLQAICKLGGVVPPEFLPPPPPPPPSAPPAPTASGDGVEAHGQGEAPQTDVETGVAGMETSGPEQQQQPPAESVRVGDAAEGASPATMQQQQQQQQQEGVAMETEGAEGPVGLVVRVQAQGAAISSQQQGVSGQDDPSQYLVESVTYAARMLENLAGHQETAKSFVERNGMDLLLSMYRLPALPATFGSTNASHALLTTFRVLTTNIPSSMLPKVFSPLRTALKLTLDKALSQAVLEGGTACIPTLPEARRDAYVRELSTAEGLTALAAQVVRNSVSVLSDAATGGSDSIISSVAALENIVLRQVAVADEWLLQNEAAKEKEKEKAEARGNTSGSTVGGEEATGQQQTAAQPDDDHAMLDGSEAGPSSGAGAQASRPRGDEEPARPSAPASASASHKTKKSPEEVVYDIMLHFLHTARAFYQGVAKAIHVPSRRREESSALPSPAMRAASLCLTAAMHRNLATALPSPLSADADENAVCSAYAGDLGRHWRFITRCLDQIFNIMFDSRRRTSHCLIFNYFICTGGLAAFLRQFNAAIELLRALPALDNPEEMALVRAHLHRNRRERDAGLPEKKPPLTNPSLAFRVGNENMVNSFLVLMTNMSYVTMISQSPNAGPLMVASAPGVPQISSDPAEVVRKVWGMLLGTVLPLWRDTKTLGAHPRLVQSVVSVLRNCTEHSSVTATLSNLSRSAASAQWGSSNRRRAPGEPDPNRMRQIQDMGFTQAQAQEALNRVGNHVELAIAWLAEHPEEADAIEATAQEAAERGEGAAGTSSAAAGDEEILMAAAAQAVALDGQDIFATPRQDTASPALTSTPTASLPDACVAMKECIDVITVAPSTAFFMSDLLRTLGNRGQDQRDEMAWTLLQHVAALSPVAADSATTTTSVSAGAGDATTASPTLQPAARPPYNAITALAAGPTSEVNRAKKVLGKLLLEVLDTCMADGAEYALKMKGAPTYWKVFHAKVSPSLVAEYDKFVPDEQAMWLDKMHDKARRGEYDSVEDFMGDIRRIAENAIAYNGPTGGPAKLDWMPDFAQGMVQYFEGKFGEAPRKEKIDAATEDVRAAAFRRTSALESILSIPLSQERAFAIAYLAAVLVSDSGSLREALATQGLAKTALAAIQAWHESCPEPAEGAAAMTVAQEVSSVPTPGSKAKGKAKAVAMDVETAAATATTTAAASPPTAQHPPPGAVVPKWVDCLFLVLGQMSIVQPKPTDGIGTAAAHPPAGLQQVQRALQRVDVASEGGGRPRDDVRDAPAEATTREAGEEPSRTAAGGDAATAAAQASAAGPSGSGNGNGQQGDQSSQAQEQQQAKEEAKPDPLAAALATVSHQWRVGGSLSDEEQLQAAQLSLAMVRRACVWVATWSPHHVSEEDDMLPENVRRSDPQSTVHAAMQLLARLSKRQEVAEALFHAGAHRIVLSLPHSLYRIELEPFMASLLKHLLEDARTLQVAMEAEIRSLLAQRARRNTLERSFLSEMRGSSQEAAERGAMPLRGFFSSLAPVAARSPETFMEAVRSVCQLSENTSPGGSRRAVLMLRETQLPATTSAAHTQNADAKPTGEALAGGSAPPQQQQQQQQQQQGEGQPAAMTPAAVRPDAQQERPPTSGQPQQHQHQRRRSEVPPPQGVTPSGTERKPMKKASSTMVEILDALLEVLLRYKGPPEGMTSPEPGQQKPQGEERQRSTEAAHGEGANPNWCGTDGLREADKDVASDVLTPSQVEVALQGFALRLLGEFTLAYQHCVGVLLKRDADQCAGLQSNATPGGYIRTATGGSTTPAAPGTTNKSKDRNNASTKGLFRHVMNFHLALSPSKPIPGQPQALSSSACYLLLAVCIRSAEGRRRIAAEIVRMLSQRVEHKRGKFVPTSPPAGIQLSQTPFIASADCPRPHTMAAAVALAASLLSGSSVAPRARSSTVGNAQGTVTAEIVRAMKDAGMIAALTRTLQHLDFSHRLAPKTSTTILRSLEVLTRAVKPVRGATGGERGGGRIVAPGQAVAAAQEEGPTGAAAAAAGGNGDGTTQRVGVEGAGAATGRHLPSSAGAAAGAAAPVLEEAQAGDAATPRAASGDAEAGPQALAAAHRVLGAMDRRERRDADAFDPRMFEEMMEVAYDESSDDEDESESDSERDSDGDMSMSGDEDDHDMAGGSHSEGSEGPHDMSGSEFGSSSGGEDSGSDSDDQDDDDDDNVIPIIGPDGIPLPVVLRVGGSASEDESRSDDDEDLSSASELGEDHDDDEEDEEEDGADGDVRRVINAHAEAALAAMEEADMLMAREIDEVEDDDDDDEEDDEEGVDLGFEFVDAGDGGEERYDLDGTEEYGDEDGEGIDIDEEFEDDEMAELLGFTDRDPLLDDYGWDEEPEDEAEALRQPVDIVAYGSRHHLHPGGRSYLATARRSSGLIPPRPLSARRDAAGSTDHPLLIRPSTAAGNAPAAAHAAPYAPNAGHWGFGRGTTAGVDDFEPLFNSMGFAFGGHAARSERDPEAGEMLGSLHEMLRTRHTSALLRGAYVGRPGGHRGGVGSSGGGAAAWADGDAAAASTYSSLAQMLERAVGDAMVPETQQQRRGGGAGGGGAAPRAARQFMLGIREGEDEDNEQRSTSDRSRTPTDMDDDEEDEEGHDDDDDDEGPLGAVRRHAAEIAAQVIAASRQREREGEQGDRPAAEGDQAMPEQGDEERGGPSSGGGEGAAQRPAAGGERGGGGGPSSTEVQVQGGAVQPETTTTTTTAAAAAAAAANVSTAAAIQQRHTRELSSLRDETSSPPMSRPRQRMRMTQEQDERSIARLAAATETEASGRIDGEAATEAVLPPRGEERTAAIAAALSEALASAMAGRPEILLPDAIMSGAAGAPIGEEDIDMADVEAQGARDAAAPTAAGQAEEAVPGIPAEYMGSLHPEVAAMIRSAALTAGDQEQAGAGAEPEQGRPVQPAVAGEGDGDVEADALEDIDPEFLSALPPELQAEVLEQHRQEQRTREAARARERERRARSAAAAAAAVPGGGATEAPATEAGASGDQTNAAAGDGGGGGGAGAGPSAPPAADDSDFAALLASFPEEIRDEVLIGATEEQILSLPTQQRAEARALRERYSMRMGGGIGHEGRQGPGGAPRRRLLHVMGTHEDEPQGGNFRSVISDQLAAIMRTFQGQSVLPADVDLEGMLRLDAGEARDPGFVDGDYERRLRDSLEEHVPEFFRLAAAAERRRGGPSSLATPSVPAPEPPPQMDVESVLGLLRILSLPQMAGGSHLNRLLVNLAASKETRELLLQALLALLRSPLSQDEIPDASGSSSIQGGGGGAGAMEVEGATRSSLEAMVPGLVASEKIEQTLNALGLAETKPGASAGVLPSAVLKRVMEVLQYLCRNQHKVPVALIDIQVPPLSQAALPAVLSADARGKGKARADASRTTEDAKNAIPALQVLLTLPCRPACLKSESLRTAALELLSTLLGPFEVKEQEVIDRAKREAAEKRRNEERERVRQEAEEHARGAAPAPVAMEQQQDDANAGSAEGRTEEGAPQAPASTGGDAIAIAATAGGGDDAGEGAGPPAATESRHADVAPIEADGEGGRPAAVGGAASAGDTDRPAAAAAAPAAAATVVGDVAPANAGEGSGPSAAPEKPDSGDAVAEKNANASAWYEEQTRHRPAFAAVPPEVVRALTRLLAEPELSTSEANTLKMVLMGLVVIVPALWTPVLEELGEAVSQIASRGAEAVKRLSAGDMSSASVMTSGAVQQGRLLERSLSCLWETISQLILENLDQQSPWLSESALALRESAAPVLEKMMMGLETALWHVFLNAARNMESNLKASAASTTTAGGGGAGANRESSRVMPPGAVQLQPYLESFFLLAECHRALHAPLESLAAESATKQAEQDPTAPEPPLFNSAGSWIQSSGSLPTAASLGPSPPMGGAAAAGGSSYLVDRSQSQTLGGGSQLLAEAAGSSPPKRWTPSILRLSAGETALVRFADRHRRLINLMVHHNPELLSGSMALLLRVPRLLDFDNKRAYFRSSLKNQARSAGSHRSLSLSIRRRHIFEDSFNQLRMQPKEAFRSKLTVTFTGEEGVDAGGLTREWFQIMSREMFNPAISLFEAVPPGSSTFQPNPNSVIQSDPARGTNHLDFFKFVGRVVGKALRDGQHIDAHFTRSFYKHMLGSALTYEDIEAVDPDYFKNLKWMLENDITDVLDLVFAEEADFFGRKTMEELCPGGAATKVTNENKREYVDLVARHRMTTAIRPQIDSFLAGFWDVVPRHRLTIFNDHELELLISGLPDIDIGDLRANTEYNSPYSATTPVIHWFWDVAGELEREDRALLLQFVTGTSKVPLDGFKALQGVGGPQKFSIHKAFGPSDRLPTAHTCFNQLDLPEYESKEQLKDRLLTAIREGTEGFAFI